MSFSSTSPEHSVRDHKNQSGYLVAHPATIGADNLFTVNTWTTPLPSLPSVGLYSLGSLAEEPHSDARSWCTEQRRFHTTVLWSCRS